MIDVTIHQLRVFREIAARGTMAAAAESLGYTPSAISQTINAMEKVLGHKVLERVGRSVRPTDLGRELLVHANELLSGLERAEVELERAVSEPRGRFTIGVFESFALTVLPSLLGVMEEDHPELEIHTREAPLAEFDGQVLSGSLDLAFVIGYPHSPVPLPAGLVDEPILTERFWLVVPRGHDMSGRRVAVTELADEALIAPPPDVGCGRCVQLACRSAGFEPRIRHQIDDYTSAIRMVEAGLGLALVPDLGLVGISGEVEVLELSDVVNREVLAVYRESSSGRPALLSILAVTKAIADEVGGLDPTALAA